MDITRRQSQYWVFTINNPDGDIELFDMEKIQYMIYQYEIGQEGTEHMQGYVIFKRPIRFSTIKNMVPRAHWEPRFGTHQQCVDYCSKLETRKSGTEPIIFGEYKDNQKIKKQPISKPKGTQTLELKQLLDDGASIKKVADEHFSLFLRYGKMFHSYRAISITPRNYKTTCIVIYGPTNTGKSKWCLDNFPNAYWKPKGKWWDGYEGQDVVIIDEFYGWFGWDYLLRLTDRYPLILEGKAISGGYQFTSKIIIFTSNKHWNQWYPNISDCSPLERRFECVWLKHSKNADPLIEKGVSPNELLTLYTNNTLNTITDLENYITNEYQPQEGSQGGVSTFSQLLQTFESQENENTTFENCENFNNPNQSSNQFFD